MEGFSIDNERQLAVYMSGVNAETYDRPDEPTADADGHIVTGTVLRRKQIDRSLIPVRVRIAHGVGAQTAVDMLRKMADMLESDQSFLSALPGTALRRMPDGSAVRKRLTPESIKQAAERLGDEERRRVLSMMDEIRLEITDEHAES